MSRTEPNTTGLRVPQDRLIPAVDELESVDSMNAAQCYMYRTVPAAP